VQASSYSRMTVGVMSPACKIGTLDGACCSTDATFEELGISGGSEEESEEEDGGGDGDGVKAGGGDDDGVRLRCTAASSCEGKFRTFCCLLVRREVGTEGSRRDSLADAFTNAATKAVAVITADRTMGTLTGLSTGLGCTADMCHSGSENRGQKYLSLKIQKK
jgi:hypothetical protein